MSCIYIVFQNKIFPFLEPVVSKYARFVYVLGAILLLLLDIVVYRSLFDSNSYQPMSMLKSHMRHHHYIIQRNVLSVTYVTEILTLTVFVTLSN